MSRSRILVTGASGLLGLNACLQLESRCAVTGVVHERCLQGAPFQTVTADLLLESCADRIVDAVRPDAIIHCAALADVDAAEADPVRAERLNAWLPAQLARRAAGSGMQFLHISTDAVFDGARGDYTESDSPAPLSVYAKTKALAEREVLREYPAAVVARVNFYGWSLSGRRSLAEWFINSLSQGTRVKGFNDVWFCPLLVNDLIEILVDVLERRLSGLFNVVSREAITKYEFGIRLARRFGLQEALIAPAVLASAGLAAPRAARLTLSTKKISAALSRELPGVDEGLDRFHELHRAGYGERLRNLAVG